MIDVLKRLAELDAANPQVENKLATVESLMTVSNGSEVPVNECGMMGAGMGPGHSPANISITANSGDELSSMLKTIMSLAGVDKDTSHQEIEIGTPHVVEPSTGDDMAANIDLITKMSGDEEEADADSLNLKKGDDAEEGWKGQLAGGTAGAIGGTIAGTAAGGPVGGLVGSALGGTAGQMAGDALGDKVSGGDDGEDDKPEEGMLGTAVGAGLGGALGGPFGAALGSVAGHELTKDDEDENEGMYDNSPDPEVEPHDYGDKQVKPKPQGLKQRMGDNPYKPAQESVDAVASQLMDEYRQFIGESGVTEYSKLGKWKYTTHGRDSVNKLAQQAADTDDADKAKKLISKALKRQDNVRKVEKSLVGGGMHESSVDESLSDIMHLAFGRSAKQ